MSPSSAGFGLCDPYEALGRRKLQDVLAEQGAIRSNDLPNVPPSTWAELRRALSAVRALPGSAEAVPLPDPSVDAVLAGHALHWFDMAVTGPEIARVLVPDGILAGVWNVIDDRRRVGCRAGAGRRKRGRRPA